LRRVKRLLTPLPFTFRKANAARENDQGRESPAAGRGKVCFTPVNFLICFQRTEKPIGTRFTRSKSPKSLLGPLLPPSCRAMTNPFLMTIDDKSGPRKRKLAQLLLFLHRRANLLKSKVLRVKPA